ncbi:MAG: hypothetical protein ACF8Q5_03960 [Phycisphaerales bacterium JB040]
MIASDAMRVSRPWLVAGGLCSLLAHASLGVLVAAVPETTLAERAADGADPDRPEPPRPRLGIERSSVATLNWLGFEDPTEHATPNPFELDQAALTRNPSPEAPIEETPSPGASSASAPSQPVQTPPLPEALARANPDAPEAAPGEAPVLLPPPSTADTATDEIDPAQLETSRSLTPEPAERTPSSEPTPAETPSTDPPAATTPPAPGELDDRDADPVSREVSLTFDRMGRPAAGEGIEIQTVRLDSREKAARFLVLSLKDPVFEIEFRKQEEGPATVARADFLSVKQPSGEYQTRSTGNADIDRILRLNVYRWTATGEAFEPLEVGDSVTIKLSLQLR